MIRVTLCSLGVRGSDSTKSMAELMGSGISAIQSQAAQSTGQHRAAQGSQALAAPHGSASWCIRDLHQGYSSPASMATMAAATSGSAQLASGTVGRLDSSIIAAACASQAAFLASSLPAAVGGSVLVVSTILIVVGVAAKGLTGMQATQDAIEWLGRATLNTHHRR